MRSWRHSRTAKTISLEQLRETGTKIDGDEFYDILDPGTAFETKILDEIKMEEFKEQLSETDRRILELRTEGCTHREIAKEVGYKTPSAVSKRIERIAAKFEDFVSEEYSSFLENYVM